MIRDPWGKHVYEGWCGEVRDSDWWRVEVAQLDVEIKRAARELAERLKR